jgi:hypothetical protein
MIVAAAIKTSDGKTWSAPKPKRHHHVFDVIWRGIGLPDTNCVLFDDMDRRRFQDYIRGHVSGFVTDAGEFLDRDASLEHVRACGQPFVKGRVDSATKKPVPDDEIIGGVLTSEDLWDSSWGPSSSMMGHGM